MKSTRPKGQYPFEKQTCRLNESHPFLTSCLSDLVTSDLASLTDLFKVLGVTISLIMHSPRLLFPASSSEV